MIYTTGSTPLGGILLGDTAILSIAPGSGVFEIPLTVTMTVNQEGWAIRYTIDGSEPTGAATLYAGPVVFGGDVTVRARGFRGEESTEIFEASYVLVPAIAISPGEGPHETWVEASLACDDPDYTLHLTTDGTAPDATSPEYEGPWWVSEDTTVKAIGFRASDGRATLAKTLAMGFSLATVTVTPGAGAYYYRRPSEAPEIVLSCDREGHTLHYSWNGEDPTLGGTLFTDPISLLTSGTLMAMARKEGVPASALQVVAYAMRTMVTATTGLSWMASGERVTSQCGASWSQALAMDAKSGCPWRPTALTDTLHLVSWSLTGRADAGVTTPWSPTAHADAAGSYSWGQTLIADVPTRFPWAPAETMAISRLTPWTKAGQVDGQAMLRWSEARKRDFAATLPWSRARVVDTRAEIPWARTRPLDVAHYAPFLPSEGEPVHQRLIKQIGLPWMAVARLIMTQQDITFTRVDTGEKVAILSGSFGLDDHSYPYSFSGVVASRAELDKIRPTSMPVEVELSVNGYAGRFLVTGYSENREWGSGTYAITGVSPAVVLGAPYCPRYTRTFSGITAQQVVAQALDGSGWSFEWRLLENPWIINGELCVVDATRIEIIDAIVKACGGMIQTDSVEKRLWLMPRHKVSPWKYHTVIADEILMQGILSVSEQYQARPGYNQVIVSGVRTGEIDTIRREGTPGDKPAPDIAEALLNNQAVCIERGKTELADNGPDVTRYTLELPLPNKESGQRPKRLFPGEIIEVKDKGIWRGRVAATEIGFVPGQTRQRVTVERYHV